MKNKNYFLIIIFCFLVCAPVQQDLDTTRPAGALLRLWPNFFPQFKPSERRELKFYQITSTNSSGIITGKTVEINVPFGTNLESQVATFFHTGLRATVGSVEQRSGETSNNFARDLVFQTSAVNGSVSDYTIQTRIGAVDSKTLLGFQFDSLGARGIIEGSNVTVYVPNGTDMKNLIPTFSHSGQRALVNGVEQISGTTAGDYSAPVNFVIRASDGTTNQYTITTNIGTIASKELKFFRLNSANATIVGTNAFVSLPFGTAVTSLSAVFAHTGKRILVNGREQVSGETENDFTTPLRFTIIAFDDSTQDYTIVVTFVNPSATTTTATTTTSSNTATSPVIETQSFTDNGNGTIRDNNTGLTWMKCPMSNVSGTPRSGNDCLGGTIGTYQFCSANGHDCNGGSSATTLQPSSAWLNGRTSSLWNACNNANSSGGFAGRTNWRVPTRAELVSIVDYSRTAGPIINIAFFPNTPNANFWSATPVASGTNNSWNLRFGDGEVDTQPKITNIHLRCVSR